MGVDASTVKAQNDYSRPKKANDRCGAHTVRAHSGGFTEVFVMRLVTFGRRQVEYVVPDGEMSGNLRVCQHPEERKDRGTISKPPVKSRFELRSAIECRMQRNYLRAWRWNVYAKLTAQRGVVESKQELTARVSGDGCRREFPIRLSVGPARPAAALPAQKAQYVIVERGAR